VFQTVSIQNTGDTPLSFGAVQLIGTDAGSFQLGFNGCPASLDAGMSCSMDVGFRPAAAGALQATLRIESDDPASPLDVPLSGTGTTPQLSVTPTSVDFGELEVGTASPERTVTVSNGGTGSLFVGSIWMQGSDGDFQVVGSDCPGRTLRADETCTVGIVFAPRRLGARTATLMVDSDAGSRSVPLTGRSSADGTAVLTLAPNPADFGSVAPGSSRQLRIHVTNSGDGTLVFGNGEPVLTGDIDQFGFVEATCGDLLAPGASCTATFFFNPTSNGPKSAAFGVQSNAANSPTTLEVRGYGGTPPAPQHPPIVAVSVPPVAAPTPTAASAEVPLDVRWQQPSMVVVLKKKARKNVTATYEISGPADLRISLRARSGKTIWSITTSAGRAGTYQVTVSRQLLRTLHGRYRLVLEATHDAEQASATMRIRIRHKQPPRLAS
jgi:hypothetical protein